MSDLSREVLRLYQPLGLKSLLYSRLRWNLCPFEKIAEFIPEKSKVLDLGCGVGMLANYLHLRNPQTQVLGIDASPKRIANANQTIRRRKGISFKQTNVMQLKEKRPFETVVMSDFLHHLKHHDQKELIQDVYQKLPKGGRLVIEEVIEKPTWKRWYSDWIDRLLNGGEISHFRTRKEWQDLLEKLGFQVKVYLAHQKLPSSDAIFVAIKS